jgi:pterin-4a-carbinolamine dehydratase
MSEWKVDDRGQLFRKFKFKNFIEGFAFSSKVALLAE